MRRLQRGAGTVFAFEVDSTRRIASQAVTQSHTAAATTPQNVERGVERAVRTRINGLLLAREGAAMGGARGAHAVRTAPPQTPFRMDRTPTCTTGRAADVRSENRAIGEGRAGARGAKREARGHGHVARHSPTLDVDVPTEGVRMGGVCAGTAPMAPAGERRETFFEEAADRFEKRQQCECFRGGCSRRRAGTGRTRPMKYIKKNDDRICQRKKKKNNTYKPAFYGTIDKSIN